MCKSSSRILPLYALCSNIEICARTNYRYLITMFTRLLYRINMDKSRLITKTFDWSQHIVSNLQPSPSSSSSSSSSISATVGKNLNNSTVIDSNTSNNGNNHGNAGTSSSNYQNTMNIVRNFPHH
ncbi:hypothetical protein SSS_10530 [Sarcoptes scabiei]|nr:hypothetical protein SSS_10530 [Sarcoptes scabiei]